jgi:hypothetical protein
MPSMNLIERRGEWKQIPCDNNQFRSELVRWIYTKWTIVIYPGSNAVMTITKDGESRTYKIKEDEKNEFTISIKKTFVRAIAGAAGLFKFFDEWCWDSHCGHVYIWLNKLWDNVAKYS